MYELNAAENEVAQQMASLAQMHDVKILIESKTMSNPFPDLSPSAIHSYIEFISCVYGTLRMS